jgi:hypothetical protein
MPPRLEDLPIGPANAEAANAVRAAVMAIEQQFGHDAESHAIVARLRLLIRVLEQRTRTCKRCGAAFRPSNAAVLSAFRRGVALPWHCAACRANRRDERRCVQANDCSGGEQ